MKKLNNVSYKDLNAAAIKNGYVIDDIIDGCLIDSVLYIKPETKTQEAVLIAGFETYLNNCSSCLTVYIARTEKDRVKLLNRWYEYRDKIA